MSQEELTKWEAKLSAPMEGQSDMDDDEWGTVITPDATLA